MLLRRTNEGEGSEEEVDGDGDDDGDDDGVRRGLPGDESDEEVEYSDGDDDDASTTVDDENGLDPANPRGQALETAR